LKVQAQKAAEHYKHVSELVKYSELNMDKCVYKYFWDENNHSVPQEKVKGVAEACANQEGR
jgi:hypothetical protein